MWHAGALSGISFPARRKTKDSRRQKKWLPRLPHILESWHGVLAPRPGPHYHGEGDTDARGEGDPAARPTSGQ